MITTKHLATVSALLAASYLSVCAFAGTAPNVKVGDPANPMQLRQAILDAYSSGAKKVTIAPGTYLLPAGQDAGLAFSNLKNFEIDAQGVDFSLESTDQDAVQFSHCESVIFKGAAIHFSHPQTGQAKILAIGQDDTGIYYDIELDAGYPLDADFKSSAVKVGDTPLIRDGSGDFGAKSIKILNGTGKERIYWDGVPKDNLWGVMPGDHVVCRGPGGMMLHAIGCKHCTFQDVAIYWSGCFAYFDTDGCVADRYLHDTLSYGPLPPGATNKPLLSESADAFHCPGALVGPDIEDCTFEGMLDDGIAIHGSYYQIDQSDANTLTIGSRWNSLDFSPGDPIRIQNDKTGLILDAQVTSVAPTTYTASRVSRYGAFKDKLNYFKVDINKTVDCPFDSLASDPAHSGSGFKIIGCTIRNHRARGMLIKADDGLIENNLVDGSSIAGIVISPETYWGEAGYSSNIKVVGNTIRHTNYAMTGSWYPQAGALTIMGEGSMGQRGITIVGNTFEDLNVANIEVRWADGVAISNNRFLNPHQNPSTAGAVGKDNGVDSNSVIWIGDSKNVTISGNWVKNPGGNGSLVTVAKTASNVTGANSGMTISASAQHKLSQTLTYKNPLLFPGPDNHGELRDPCIIRHGDHYYLVYTMWPFSDISGRDPSKPDMGSSPGIQMFVSTDLTNWKPLTWLVKFADLPDDCPYKGRFWAPEIHEHNGKFYLIFYADNWIDSKYNGDGKPGYHAFIGVSNKVDGPYEHISYLPDSACDTTLLFDDDGRTFAIMPYGDMFEQQVDLSKIEQGKLSYIGLRTKILSHDNSDISLPSPKYLEGPWAMKVKKRYYLFYAETYPDAYWTGVAYADSPTGPWHKDPRGNVFWGGHLAVFNGPDGRNWFSYREEKFDEGRGLLAVDPFDIAGDGAIQVQGPTNTSQTVTIRPAAK